jgi:hypothetical protein
MRSLPTRSTLRGSASPAAPKPVPQPETAPAHAEPRAPLPVPGGGDTDETGSIWDGTMGPLGIILTALVACGLGYLAFKLFN